VIDFNIDHNWLELNMFNFQTHDAAIAQLTNEHNQALAEIRSAHQQELDRIQKNTDEMKTEQIRLLDSTSRSNYSSRCSTTI